VATSSTTPTTPAQPIGETPRPAILSPGQAMQLEKDVIEFTDRLFDTATNDQDYQKEVRETMALVDYVFKNRHWNERARFSRNRPVLPKARRHTWETASLLTDLALDFQIRTYDHFDKHSEFENMLNELCTVWALRNDFEDSIYDTVLYGLLHTGPAKIQWNSTLNGGMGDVQILSIAPWQWATLGCGSKPQDAECIIYYPVVTKDALIRRFGKTAMRVECDADFGPALSGNFNRPSGLSKSSWAGMSQTLRQKLGVKSSAGSDNPYPSAVQREFWLNDDQINDKSFTVTVGPALANGEPAVNLAYRVEPGEKLYPRGRVIATAGGAVLEDQCNPYWHAKKPFPVYRPLRLPWQMSGDCHDDKTEVLTQRGWLNFKDINGEDFLATRQMQTGIFEWQHPTALVKSPYKGRMCHFKTRSIDICVTPRHRMLLSRPSIGIDPTCRKRGPLLGKRKEIVCTAEQLAEYGTHHTTIPQTSVWVGIEVGAKVFECELEERTARMVAKANRVGRAGMTVTSAIAVAKAHGKSVSMTGDEYCAFMGAFLSEGWTGKYTTNISQFPASKGMEPYRKLLTEILGKEPKHTGTDFVISRQGLRDHCHQFGTRAWLKFIPSEIMNATSRQIKIFWDYFLLGDGCVYREKYERISTSSPIMAGQLMELAQKMGLSASITTVPAGTYEILGVLRDCKTQYVVNLRRSKDTVIKGKYFSYTDYDGMIYCAEVPNGFLYTRRNGKPAWTGNSSIKPWTLMNTTINKLMGGQLDAIYALNEPTLIAPKGAFPAGDWESLDPGAAGGKIKYNNNAPKAPEFAKRGEFPFAPASQAIDQISKELDMSSGASAMSQALNKKQVPGGDTLEMILSSRSLPIRLSSRALTGFVEDVGYMGTANILQFYSVAHRVAILGERGIMPSDYQPVYGSFYSKGFGMKPEEFIRRFAFTVKPDSTLASGRDTKIPIALQLRKQGDLSRKNLFRQIDKNFDDESNEAELIREAKLKLVLGAIGAAAQGKGQKKK
jgi:hypothetical protein